MKTRHTHETGAVSGSLIAIIALIVGILAAGSAAIWAYMNYMSQKTNVDSIVAVEVAEAKKTQFDEDFKKFQEEEKQPNRQFVGPDDYGRLTFNYPKTWSVYVARDVTKGGTFEAYLNPVSVPPIASTTRYALRVEIINRDYEDIVRGYDSLVKRGELKSSPVSVNGNSGTRLDGNFTKEIRGSAVVYKVRDKTIVLRTDANAFKNDFEALIKTITFNS